MSGTLLNKLIRTIKKVAFNLKEKQRMTIDDHILEHLLFYHDLAGSNLENNRETRIVQADIKEAIERKSSAELCLALKLPPNLWDEQLKNIISGLDDSQKKIIGDLLLSSNNSYHQGKSFALTHADWNVRANAANILALLEMKEAAPILAESLSDDTISGTRSFCYIAYALAKLQGVAGKEALEKHLCNEDSWLRVDAAGALSYFPFFEIADQLSKALLIEQENLDYMAYAMAKNISPMDFLEKGQKEYAQAAARQIFGILEAMEHSFSHDLISNTKSHLCLEQLVQTARLEADPIVLDTALQLCDWLLAKNDHTLLNELPQNYLETVEEHREILEKIAQNQDTQEIILKTLEKAILSEAGEKDGQLIHSLRLAGQFDILKTRETLLKLLQECHNKLSTKELNNVILALGKLSNEKEENAKSLIAFARKLVNFDERINLTKHKQPVLEENTARIKTYWETLQALGYIVSDNAANFLVDALQDYAPDMRASALESIVRIYEKSPEINLSISLIDILKNGLTDPSPLVQLAALSGIRGLIPSKFIDDEANAIIDNIIPLINAQENTLSKQAISCIDDIVTNCHTIDSKTILKNKVKSIKEEEKKKSILDIVQRC